MSAEEKKDPKVVVMTLKTVAGGNELVIQTHFDRDESPEKQDEFLDKMVERIERQKAKCNVPNLERDLRKSKAALEQIKKRLDDLDKDIDEAHAKSGRNGPARTSEPQKAQREQLLIQQKEMLEGVLYEESRLRAMKAKFGFQDEDKPKKAAKAA